MTKKVKTLIGLLLITFHLMGVQSFTDYQDLVAGSDILGDDELIDGEY